jgi:hypothetical protein
MRKKQTMAACFTVLLGMFILVLQSTIADTLYVERFSTDVFSAGEWTRSDIAVVVDTLNGWLHIGADGDIWDMDNAERADSFSLPIVVESRMKAQNALPHGDYRLPWFTLFFDPSLSMPPFDITYLCCGPQWGWKFYQWTGLDTRAPESANVWRTIRAIIRPDGGKLFTKADDDTSFTSIADLDWSIPNEIVKLRFQQPWDAVCDIDYILVTKWGCDSLFVGSHTVCLDPRLHKVPLIVKNLDTLKAMTIPLHPEITCPNFTVDSVSFAGTRIEDWESKTVIVGQDSIVLGLVANLGGGTPPLLPGEGAIANIYYTIECDPAHTGETCYFSLDTTTIQPENQHLVFVDNHNNEFIPYFEPGSTTMNLYRPGDANCNCEINIADVVVMINYLFIEGPEPCPMDAGDANGDCNVNVADAIYLINYLFIGGPAPVCGCASNPLFANCCGGGGPLSSSANSTTVHKSVGTARIGFSEAKGAKDSQLEISILGDFNVDVSGLQLEISYDPKEITLLEPSLTSRTQGLQLYSSTKDGVQKIGILDINGRNHILPGQGPLVTLRAKSSNPSSLVIKEAVLVDKDAHTIPVEIVKTIGPTEDNSVPQNFSLAQNYPNPFNPATRIQFTVTSGQFPVPTTLKIYNVRGQLVRTLVDEPKMTGPYEVMWDGKDNRGEIVSSGVYFYKLKAGDYSETKKMILMK